jgi:hypothetical protein
MEDLLTFVLHVGGVEHSPQRRKLNFIGAALSDDPINEWTNVYIGNTNDWKDSVRVATTEDMAAARVNNTLTASGNGNINTIGGIDTITNLALDDLVLVRSEAAASDNGIYRITDLGTAGTPWVMVRATLADDSEEVTTGLTTYVEEGALYGRTTWTLKTLNVILNTTILEFESIDVVPSVPITFADSPYTATVQRRVILADTSGGAIVINIPPAADWKGGTITVKDAVGNAAAAAISMIPNGGEKIDGAGAVSITVAWRAFVLYSDGSNVFNIGRWQ